MPIYEYACPKCRHEFEAEQRITDDPIRTCPECRSRSVKRLISQTSFVLKGGGWYNDLYSSTGGVDKDKDKEKDTAKGDGAEKESAASPGSAESKSSGAGDKPAKSDTASKRSRKKGGKSAKAVA